MTPTVPPPGWRVASTTVSRKLGSASSGLATSRTPLGASCAAAAAARSQRAAARSPVRPDIAPLVYASPRSRAFRRREEDQSRQVVRDAVEAVVDGGAPGRVAPGSPAPAPLPAPRPARAAGVVVALASGGRLRGARPPRRQHVDAHAQRRHPQELEPRPPRCAVLLEQLG